jgi:AcrR family transcriptional regulator
MAKRLTGEEARARILDAASAQLTSEGPRGLRLDTIAEELGISRQAILHHFGTRDGLIAAVVQRALERLQSELAGGLLALSDHDRGSQVLVERTFDVIVDKGYGRLIAWLALEHDDGKLDLFGADQALLASLAKISHALRERELGPTEFRDTLFTFVLSTYAILGSAVFERGVYRSAGLADDASAHREFRAWLSALLVEHLEGKKTKPE